jgi:tRNA (cytidine/uridine-2'-O-)-methyltransferase
MVAIALFQPDIPPNTAAILRLAACLGVPVHIVEPVGFDLSDRAVRRAGMDYLDHAVIIRHRQFSDFAASDAVRGRRLVLMTTKGDLAYTRYTFTTGDIILFGRESAGVPPPVHAAAAARLTIPMVPHLRSLNVATAVAMAIGEALRQTNGFPRAQR